LLFIFDVRNAFVLWLCIICL